MTTDDEENSWENHRKNMREFLESAHHTYTDVNDRDLSEALYTMNEMNMWDDDIELSSAAFKKAIALYHALIKNGSFPKNLRM